MALQLPLMDANVVVQHRARVLVPRTTNNSPCMLTLMSPCLICPMVHRPMETTLWVMDTRIRIHSPNRNNRRAAILEHIAMGLPTMYQPTVLLLVVEAMDIKFGAS